MANSSNINIDYKKYYKYQNDVYHLHFLNRGGLSKDEIRKKFSSYGNVVNVTGNSFLYSMRFVTFKTETETINCIKGLQGSDIELLPEIKLLMQYEGNKRDKDSLVQLNTKPPHNKTHDSCKEERNKRTTHENNKSFLETSDNEHSCNVEYLENVCDFLDITSASKYSESVHNEEKNSMSSEKFVQDSTNNGFSNEIEWEKFAKIDKNGNYCVHFYERNNLSQKEIENIFSNYGNVISVQFGIKNDIDTTLRLVRYRTAAEVISCIRGLQNNKQIKLLPQKYHKIINLTTVKTEQSKNKDQKQTTEATRTRNSDRAAEQKEESNSTTKRDACYKMPSLLSYYKIPSLVSDNGDSESHTEVEHGKANMEKSFQVQPMTKNSSTRRKVIPLQEVIVANIHENYGAPYILHLLEQKKYEPIAIKFVNNTKVNKVRYCMVYLKTFKEAIAIEKELDNFCLSGKNIIVLRLSRLTKE